MFFKKTISSSIYLKIIFDEKLCFTSIYWNKINNNIP